MDRINRLLKIDGRSCAATSTTSERPTGSPIAEKALERSGALDDIERRIQGRSAAARLTDMVCGLDRALAILAAPTAAVLAATALQGPGWPPWAVGALAVALGLSVMAWTAPCLAAAVAVPPFEASAVTAWAMLFTFAGVALAAPVVGLVVEHGGGYASGFVALAVLAALALALLAMRRRQAEDMCHDDAPDPPPPR